MKIRQEADGSITVVCGEQEINILANAFSPTIGSESLRGSDAPAKPRIIEPPPPGPEGPPATHPELPPAPIKTKPTHVAYRVKIFGETPLIEARTRANPDYEVTELLNTQARASDGSVSYLFIGTTSSSRVEGWAELEAAIARAYLQPMRR